MSIAKKDYTLIAETLRDQLRACNQIGNLHEKLSAKITIRNTAYYMDGLFQSLYVNYNSEKFLAVALEDDDK
jgi:hypothetical protein